MSKAADIMLQSIDRTRRARCRYCRASIVWAVTAAGKRMCLNPSALSNLRAMAGQRGYVVSNEYLHWATCPPHLRRAANTAPSERID